MRTFDSSIPKHASMCLYVSVSSRKEGVSEKGIEGEKEHKEEGKKKDILFTITK
jgi:hypothetical protein